MQTIFLGMFDYCLIFSYSHLLIFPKNTNVLTFFTFSTVLTFF